MVIMRDKKMRIAVFAALFLLGTIGIFPQDELAQRGSIPDELLRPRKSESPRYPIDTVIGELGQGKAPKEAYDIARNAAAALLAGNAQASVLSPAKSVDRESWMAILNTINPQVYRLGGGREEPDGSVSFLVRFAGREQGITGELFIRVEERRQTPAREAAPPPPAVETNIETEAEDDSAEQAEENQLARQVVATEVAERAIEAVPPPTPAQTAPATVTKRWFFEDLILKEARSREEENSETNHRFDFSPYQRFF
jgi:hypothetical protein